MDPTPTNEAALLTKLQTSTNLTGIHSLYTSHLSPFPIPNPNNSKTLAPTPRTLAKQFLSFIHTSLTLLPKRLSETLPKPSALELLRVYRLCLDCLDFISPELSGKPHAAHVQRIRYLHCLEKWEMYSEAEGECLKVLEGLKGIVEGGEKKKGRKSKEKGRLVPEVEENVDKEVGSLVVEVVVTIVKCVGKRKSRDVGDYSRVVALVEQSQPWLKYVCVCVVCICVDIC